MGRPFQALNQATNQIQQAAADENGNLRFQDVSPGSYLLKAEASGFEPHQAVLTVGLEEMPPLKIKLKSRTASRF